MWTIVMAILIALFIWKVILPALFYLGLFGTLRVAGSAHRKEQKQAQKDAQYKERKLKEFGERYQNPPKSDERLIASIWK